ncbi:hypothetical protein U1Q18_005453 [Sarracenia purpurea var. burkii]
MLFLEEPVRFEFPVFDCTAMPGDFFEPGLPTNSTSSSETSRTIHCVEERKQRRMLSNRESARRSRWRKKRHLENLTNEVNRLRLEKRELKNRLCMVSHEYLVAQTETNRLQTESLQLQQRLSGLCQILDTMQLQY